MKNLAANMIYIIFFLIFLGYYVLNNMSVLIIFLTILVCIIRQYIKKRDQLIENKYQKDCASLKFDLKHNMKTNLKNFRFIFYKFNSNHIIRNWIESNYDIDFVEIMDSYIESQFPKRQSYNNLIIHLNMYGFPVYFKNENREEFFKKQKMRDPHYLLQLMFLNLSVKDKVKYRSKIIDLINSSYIMPPERISSSTFGIYPKITQFLSKNFDPILYPKIVKIFNSNNILEKNDWPKP